MKFPDGNEACNRCGFFRSVDGTVKVWGYLSEGTTLEESEVTPESVEPGSLMTGSKGTSETSQVDIPKLPTGEKDRGIRGSIMSKYGIRFEFNSSDRSIAKHYYPVTVDSSVVSYKRRDCDTKSFSFTESIKGKKIDLFGMLSSDKKKGMNVVITEGELDAPSAYQMLDGRVHDLLCLSLPNGSNPKQVISDNLEFLNDQATVTLAYDQDEAGYSAEEDTWKLMPNVKIMSFSENDPNAMLTALKMNEFRNAYDNAKKFKPKTMASVEAMEDDDCISPVLMGLSYPWDSLTKMTYGLHTNQVIGIGAAPGAGKALRNGQTVVTAEGDVPVEDLKVGQNVIGTEGVCEVTGVYPQGLRDIYRVSFTDGTYLDVDRSHLWTFNHTKGGTRTLETGDAISRYLQGAEKKKIFSLPKYAPVPSSYKELEVDPYLLGVWLGDGSTNNSRVSCPPGKIEDDLFDYYNEKHQYHFKYGLQMSLRSIGVLGNKHIPEPYFYGSVEQRKRLLKGLLDTDGHNAGNRGWQFDNTNRTLWEGVIRLARSLGLIATKQKTRVGSYVNSEGERVPCKLVYRCQIKKPGTRVDKRYVSSIKYIGSYEATCISVDSKDSLFLAGDYIPTHNTTLVRGIQQHLMFTHGEKIGIFSLEEKAEWTTRQLIGYILNKPIHKPGVRYDRKKAAAIKKSLEGKAYFYEHQYYTGQWGEIEQMIRYLHSIGVRFFFIDPLSSLVSHLTPSEANQYLSECMYALSKLVQTIDITVFHVNHLNTAGDGKSHEAGARVYSSQFTGSRAQWRYSHGLIGAERDVLATDGTQDIMTLRYLKDRAFGNTGATCQLEFNHMTGRLEDSKKPLIIR